MQNNEIVHNDELIQNLFTLSTEANGKFITLSPLYKSYKLDKEHLSNFEYFLSKDVRFDDLFDLPVIFDTYCTKCKKESTFKNLFSEDERTITNFEIEHLKGHRKTYDLKWNRERIYVKEFVCARNGDHINTYIFLLSKSNQFSKANSTFSITKIGEYPSALESHSTSLKKYKKHFSDYHDELVRSLKIYSSGIGVGAFVYLRRIFENLVWDAFKRLKETESQISENDFKEKKMVEKIEYLKDELPEFLVDNKIVYSILSKGIHSLEESTCLQMYNFIKDSILLILDQEIERREKEIKTDKLKKEINHVNSTLGNM